MFTCIVKFHGPVLIPAAWYLRNETSASWRHPTLSCCACMMLPGQWLPGHTLCIIMYVNMRWYRVFYQLFEWSLTFPSAIITWYQIISWRKQCKFEIVNFTCYASLIQGFFPLASLPNLYNIIYIYFIIFFFCFFFLSFCSSTFLPRFHLGVVISFGHFIPSWITHKLQW